MNTTLLNQLEAIIGATAEDEPFAFALCLILIVYVVKNVFSMLYSAFAGK